MTAQQLIEVSERYRQSARETLENANLQDMEPALPHLHWMCEEIQALVLSGQLDRAHRYLGFVQGVLWSMGQFSISEMADHNRG